MDNAGLARKGVSEVVVTVIMFSTILGTLVVALFFAQLNLSAQSTAVEFENGKAGMVSLAQTINGLSLAEGSAAYVRVSSVSQGVFLTEGEDSLKIVVDDGQRSVQWDMGRINLVKLKGAIGASSSSFMVLEGDRSIRDKRELLGGLIINPDRPGSLGVVYQEWNYGPWVIVDFGRVRVVPSGAVPHTENGLDWYNISTVQITYFKILRGSSSGSETLDICVRVKRIKTYTPEFFSSNFVRITVNRGPESNPSLYSKSYTVRSDARNLRGMLVYLTVVEVEVSVR